MYIRFSTVLPVAALVSRCRGAHAARSSTQTSIPTTLSQLGGLLGIVLPVIDGLIGLGCSPITGLDVGSGATCTQQPVCCTDNPFNGLINLSL